MQRSEFGQLVAALRKQIFDPQTGRGWTQRELAAETGLSTKMIGDIERGRRVHLEPDVLVRLADAFGLIPLERREFFSAASGVATDAARVDLPDSHAVRAELSARLSAIQLPAYIHDPLGNVIAVNALLLALFQEVGAALDAAPCAAPVRFNQLRIPFDPHSPLRQLNCPIWHRRCLDYTAHFRIASLRYRHTEHFAHLFRALCGYSDFLRAWLGVGHGLETAGSHLPDYVYVHPRVGRLRYTLHKAATCSPAGEIYVCTLLPADSYTTACFNRLVQQINGTLHNFAPWPQAR